jgi:ATP-dependent RNA helicase DeaD
MESEQTEERQQTETQAVGFSGMNLDPAILRALEEMGFEEPREVQTAVYEPAMAGKDLIVQSKTGSGKTAAFGIPIIQRLTAEKYVQALVLCPTRELALQVANECTRIATHKHGISLVPIYGGAPMGRQIEALKAGAQMVVGTPGRIMDHVGRGTLKLDRVQMLVLDEADEMLSMGFLPAILEILELLPKEKQTLLFSATVPEEIQRIANRKMREPQKVELSGDFIGVEEIDHSYYMVSGVGRTRDLVRVLEVERPESAIIFCNTREDTSLVAAYLSRQGYHAEPISSDLTQKDRERVMGMMRRAELQYLVATDVAARGIDISDLSHVINYTFPESADVYIHRTGRTGRGGKHGKAVSLVSPQELGSFYYLKLLHKVKPVEKQLPSDAEIRTRREGEQYERVAAAVPEDVGEQWRGLAKRVWASPEGERIVGALLRRVLETKPAAPPVAVAASAPAPEAEPVRAEARSEEPRRERERDRERGGRGRDRDRGRGRGRDDRRERRPRDEGRRDEGRRDAKPEHREERREARPEKREEKREEKRPSVPPPTPAPPMADDREFWEAWVDERQKVATAPGIGPSERGANAPRPVEQSSPGPHPPLAPPVTPAPDDERRETPPLEPGMVRLYLNLGRRDRMRPPEVQALVNDRTGMPELKIQVRNTHTYITCAEAEAPQVIEKLHGTKVGDRDLVCEPAKKS